MTISIEKLHVIGEEALHKQIDFTDADDDLVSAIQAQDETVFAVCCAEKLVGVVQMETGNDAYLYIFLDPAARGSGIGRDVLALCERKLYEQGAQQIRTSYRTDHAYASSFARQNGYVRRFASAYMQYAGVPFDVGEVPLRAYCDDDYDIVQALHARAFHEMRVRVGDFPDSVIEPPSDEVRRYLASTCDGRFVYEENGEIMGYAHLCRNEISSVCVGVPYQARGIGHDLVRWLCNQVLAKGYETVSLFCVVGNTARRLYDKMGFEEKYVVEFAEKRIS